MYEKQYCRPQDQRRQKERRYSRCWADTPLQLVEQPVEKTTSEQISALQQPMENPIPEQVVMFWRKLQPMGSNHAGAGSWQELWPVERRPRLSRFCLSPWKFHTVTGCKGMLLVGRTHTEAGENCEAEGLSERSWPPLLVLQPTYASKGREEVEKSGMKEGNWAWKEGGWCGNLVLVSLLLSILLWLFNSQ